MFDQSNLYCKMHLSERNWDNDIVEYYKQKAQLFL